MSNLYIILQLLLPLFAAILLSINSQKKVAYIVTTTICGILTVTSVALLYCSYFNEYRYFFGGWVPPLGIELLINFPNAIMLSLISFSAFLTFLLGYDSFFHYKTINHSFFCSLFLIALTGMYGIVITNDFFNLYVFIEIASIALYALTSIGTIESSKAAFNYLVLGTVGATIILMGIGFLYSASGTLNIDHFIKLLPHIQNIKIVSIGATFIIVGLLLKASIFPLHSWLIDLYDTTNKIILPFLSAVSTKVYVFTLIKMITIVLPISHFAIEKIMLIAIFGLIILSIAATQQKTIRRILSYSSLANICYIFCILNVKNSIMLGLLLIVSHSLVKFSLFILTNYIIKIKKTDNLQFLNGLFFQTPLTITLFIINAASLIGLPFTIGFISKFYLTSGLLHNSYWVLISGVLLSSFIGLIYMWKIIEIMVTKTVKMKSIVLVDPQLGKKSYLIEYGILILTFINLIIGIFFIYAPFSFQLN